jgi:hypothetical protein
LLIVDETDIPKEFSQDPSLQTPRVSIPIIRSYTLKESGLTVHRFPEQDPSPKEIEILTQRGQDAYVFFNSIASLLDEQGAADSVKAFVSLVVLETPENGINYVTSASVDDILMWRNYIDYIDRQGYNLVGQARAIDDSDFTLQGDIDD